jgi:predicted AlkP superfamily pyrophosphatase or phosphodiesterase
MKKSLLLLLTTLLLITGIAQAQKEPKILFIGIDGVRSEALLQANTPHMDALFNEGLYTFDSWHLGITVSGPSWSTMLTGVWEQKHKILNNNYTNANYGQYPYFFKRLKEYRPDAKCVQIITWNPMGTTENTGGYVFNHGLNLSIDAGTHGQGLITAAAKIQLLDPELDVLFLHYDEPDATGHSSGFSPNNPQYMNSIQQVDAEIGQVVAALKARATYQQEDWLILGTTDHGGTGTGHGGNSNVERHIWWFASGESVPHLEIVGADPGSYQMPSNPVKPDVLANTPVLADIAVTALAHLLKNHATDEQFIPQWNLDGKSWLSKSTYVENNSTHYEDPNSFEVFPNPNDGLFSVSLYQAMEGANGRCAISDISGKVVMEKNIPEGSTQFQIDMSGLSQGGYLLNIYNAEKMETRKIIKY